MTTTLLFDDAGCADVREVGGKAAGLARMTGQGLPVPPGFVVPAQTYRGWFTGNGLEKPLHELFARLESDPAGQGPAVFEEVAVLMGRARLPDPERAAIAEAYTRLCEQVGVPDLSVAVRSSATAEDSVTASFAGEFETWVDVVGAESVVEHVERCYASIFSPRVLRYALDNGIIPHDIEMAVVVQKTVRARAAGVMFTLSPTSGDRSKISIEASWGLGISVVGGEVTPDRYLVDKVGLAVSDIKVGHKDIEYRRGDAPEPVPGERQDVRCLDDDEVARLAQLGKQLERQQGSPQDIEFAVDEELARGSDVVLLQCRPETVWSGRDRAPRFDPSAGMMSWITGSVSAPPTSAAAGSAAPHDREET